MNTLKVATFLLLAALLTACAGVRKNVSFAAESPEALLVFGTIAEEPTAYTVTFSTYDPPQQRLTSNSFRGQPFVEHRGVGVLYHALKVPPGTYVLKSVTRQVIPQKVICLSEGTFAFELKPGQVTYVGNLAFRSEQVARAGTEQAAAIAALKEYPNVSGELITAPLTEVTFPNGTDIFGAGEVCGGYYVKEQPRS